MAYQRILILILLSWMSVGHHQLSMGQINGLEVSRILKNETIETIPTALPYSIEHLALLSQDGIRPKYITPEWIYFNIQRDWLNQNLSNEAYSDLYFEFAPPHLLDDTARATHFVNGVHQGISPLPKGFTGKDVIIGIVDAGLDHNHPDFINAQGEKRVIRYWDHGITNPTQSPAPFNYGQIWYPHHIQNGAITSIETTGGHGTTVTGIASGNGSANGTNKGFAPEADIIVVRSNFNLPNWTMTIADACAFIFSVADSLGKPAVVNLSLGTYIGSHDGTDPASVAMEHLLDEKPSRIIVCAAGNGGNVDWFHAQNIVSSNTSFIWLKNNPTGFLGNNTIFFDLWSDASLANFNYSFGANLPSGSYLERATTIYRSTFTQIGSEIQDTLYTSNGHRLATLRIFPKIVGSNYHLQVLFSNIDSTAYNYSFKTTGTGKYDLWSGAFIGFNQLVKNVPDSASYPPIQHYVYPDSLQNIVSSWNCSEKVISVGNIRARASHIDRNFNQYSPADQTSPGKISPTSSRGPTRHGLLKPDISSSGDVTLAAGPAAILNNPSFFSAIDSGGFHLRNGGTSMASPTVAGTAALFLENCKLASWSDFKTSLLNTAFTDGFTGITPNYSYGHGKMHSFDLMVSRAIPLTIYGDPLICQSPQPFNANPPIDYYFWSNGETTSSVVVDLPTQLYLIGEDILGCSAYSDTIEIVQGNVPAIPIVAQLGTSLVSSTGPNYQWYRNDNLLLGETNQVIFPQSIGFYSVAFTNSEGCSSFSSSFQWTLSQNETTLPAFTIYPNPTMDQLTIESHEKMERIFIRDMTGKLVHKEIGALSNKVTLSIGHMTQGIYAIEVSTKNTTTHQKIIKE